MNPLIKALASALVLAASAAGTSLGHGGLPFVPMDDQSAGGDGGNETSPNPPGNGTAGNGTAGNGTGNETGNSTGDGNQTAAGNETSGDGNQTSSGNETADGNETASDDDKSADEEPTCTVAVDDYGGELFSGHHEWSWLVTGSVTHLSVAFQAYDDLGVGMSSPNVRLEDGQGRVIAHSTSGSPMLQVDLRSPSDYIDTGEWRLLYDGGEVYSDYSAHVALNC